MKDKELDKLMEYLITEAMKVAKISRKAAALRIAALHKSGLLLKLGHPDGQPFKIGIDVAMQIPQIGKE